MYDELKLVMRSMLSEEQLWSFDEAYRVLTAIGLTDFDDELQQVMGMADGDCDNYLFVSRVQDVLIYAVGDSLRQYGVVCNDDTPLYIMTGVLEALANVEHYVIPETLRDLTLMDDDPEIVLSHIVPLFTWVDESECQFYVQDVKEATITRIREIATTAIDASDSSDVPHPDTHRKVRTINALNRRESGDAPLAVVELAKSGFRLAQPMRSVLLETIDRIDTYNSERAGIELLGVVLFSDVPFNDTEQAVEVLVDDYVDNPRDRTHMELSIRNALADLEHLG